MPAFSSGSNSFFSLRNGRGSNAKGNGVQKEFQLLPTGASSFSSKKKKKIRLVSSPGESMFLDDASAEGFAAEGRRRRRQPRDPNQKGKKNAEHATSTKSIRTSLHECQEKGMTMLIPVKCTKFKINLFLSFFIGLIDGDDDQEDDDESDYAYIDRSTHSITGYINKRYVRHTVTQIKV